jgi:AraC family transcriptional regulator
MSMLAPESLIVDPRLPERTVASSAGLGWKSVFARLCEHPAAAETFTTAPTRDLLLVLVVDGSLTIEAKAPRGWRRARYRSGSMGATAPGASSTLRWHAAESEPHRSLQLLVSGQLLHETADAVGRPTAASQLPDALTFDDPVVRMTSRALAVALLERSDELYADSLTQALALHLVIGRWLGRRRATPPEVDGGIDQGTLRRVLDYMDSHLDREIALADLADIACFSKYHFLRLFTEATGMTPHRYLVMLRMQRAARLLCTTRRPVYGIAATCGYTSHGQFTKAFRRHFGMTPTQMRRDAQR